MASKLDLISRAMLLLGTPTLNTLTDGSSRANTAAALYDSTVDNLLSMNRWRFAQARMQLSQLVAAPAHTYTYAYQLPADMIAPFSIYPNTNDYEIYGDQLHSNLSEVTLTYLSRPDESKFPPYFEKAVEYRLAVEFCISVTENRALKQTLQEDFKMALATAMHADSQGRPSTAPIHNPIVDVRW